MGLCQQAIRLFLFCKVPLAGVKALRDLRGRLRLSIRPHPKDAGSGSIDQSTQELRRRRSTVHTERVRE